MIFGVAVLPFMVVNNTSAATSLTLTSSGSQSIDVLPATGTAISSDSINVTTTCRYGYNFTVQTSVDDTTLYLDGNSDGSAYTYFSPAGGFDPLNETENEWGYFYDGNTVPTNTSIFSPVPSSLEEPAIIKAPLDSPASSDINDNFNIYYGVSASANAEKGTYKMIPDEHDNDGTIVYTATIADACTRYIVHFDPTSQFEGNTISGTGTMNDQSIYEGVATPLTNNGFTAPSGYYFAGWNTAQDGSGTSYTNQQSVTDLASAGNTITLYAMWTDCPGGKICYSANVVNASDVTGSMGDQTIYNSNTKATLWAPNFKRNNYGFAAWNTKPDGTGTNYGPNQTIQFTEYSTAGLKLYAKWLASAGNMQNWSGCSSMNIGDVTALKDTRDNDVYAVAKLANGKCWMIENLRLADKDANNNYVNLTSSNTHNPSLPLTNSWYYAGSQTTLTTSNHLSSTTDPYQTAWCSGGTGVNCTDQSMLAANNTTLFTSNTSSSYSISSDVYSYGNYYNWYSATAGHKKNVNWSDYTVPGDICPVGWHLPTGASNGEYYTLNTAINTGSTSTDAGLRVYPANFVYPGYVSNASIYHRSYRANYWSATANGVNAYFLSFEETSVNPATNRTGYGLGMMVRCVAGT